MFAPLKFSIIRFGLSVMRKFTAWRYPACAARLKERELEAQIRAQMPRKSAPRGATVSDRPADALAISRSARPTQNNAMPCASAGMRMKVRCAD